MAQQVETGIALLGVTIDSVTMQEVLDRVEGHILQGGFHQIATANVDFLVNAARDEELREALNRCDLVLPDGMPLIWASRMLGAGLKERVTGIDLLPRLARLSAERGYRIFLLGAEEESSAGAAAWMERNFPGVSIAGRLCPVHRPLEGMDHEQILSRIEEAGPDILLVAFGNPKQEKWLAMHRHRLRVPVCIGVGGSFDMLSGRIPRAPAWMQRLSLEWIFRTIQDPVRLGGRYANDLWGVLRYFPPQAAAAALQPKRDAPAGIRRETAGAAEVLRIEGALAGRCVAQFDASLREALSSARHVILDMSSTASIGADALGVLVRHQGLARRSGRELWLAGPSPSLRRVIRAAMLDPAMRLSGGIGEALRRIEPEPVSLRPPGPEWGVCRIGERMVPIHALEMADVCRQLERMLEQRGLAEPIPLLSPETIQ